jgi:hypothetical protein
VIISGAGTVPSNFTVAVIVPAVDGSTGGPVGAAGGVAAFSPPHASYITMKATTTVHPNERIIPLWSC